MDTHLFINKNGYGAHGYKFFRQEDGTRIPFEITKGFKIFNFNTYEDNVSIDQLMTAYTFDGKTKQVVHSVLYLKDLLSIEVYDDKTDFISLSSIDFTYIINHKDSEIRMLSEWMNEDPGIRRARWVSSRPDIDNVLDNVSYRKKNIASKRQRVIDMEFDLITKG